MISTANSDRWTCMCHEYKLFELPFVWWLSDDSKYKTKIGYLLQSQGQGIAKSWYESLALVEKSRFISNKLLSVHNKWDPAI